MKPEIRITPENGKYVVKFNGKRWEFEKILPARDWAVSLKFKNPSVPIVDETWEGGEKL